jgi:hypothetical protein
MALSHVLNIIASGGAVSAGSNNLDSQAVTVGSHSVTYPGGSGLPTNTSNYKGFFVFNSTTYGSISDGTSNLYGGAAVTSLLYQWNNVYPVSGLTLLIAGTSRANSGWTTLTVNGTAYQRTSATYTANSSGNTQWTWPVGADYAGGSDPFSGTGTVTTCVFT